MGGSRRDRLLFFWRVIERPRRLETPLEGPHFCGPLLVYKPPPLALKHPCPNARAQEPFVAPADTRIGVFASVTLVSVFHARVVDVSGWVWPIGFIDGLAQRVLRFLCLNARMTRPLALSLLPIASLKAVLLILSRLVRFLTFPSSGAFLISIASRRSCSRSR